MGYTRRQFVTAAYAEIGLASYVFDLEPEQLELACQRLDSMMAQWNGRGLRLGYPLPGSPELTALDTETNVPDAANEAIITGLAVRIAPGLGKSVSPDTKMMAKAGYDMLLSRAAMPPEMQLTGNVPLGAGNKPWRENVEYVSPPRDPLIAGGDAVMEFE